MRQLVTWASVRTGLLGAVSRWVGTNRAAMTMTLKPLVRDETRLTEALIDEVMSAAAQQGGFEAFEQWQHDQVLWNRLRTDYAGRLTALRPPTLLIHGERDTGVPVARARDAARLIPDSTLKVIADAGHWVQRDRPDEVVDAMIGFLRAS